MRVILDTNIIILREDSRRVQENVQSLTERLNKYQISSLIHPASKEDIKHDSDEERKKIIFSKLNTYHSLESPPSPDDDVDFKKKIGSQNPKAVDNLILYAIYKDAANFLITEDKGIKRSACKLNLEDRIFNIDEMIVYIDKLFSVTEVQTPVVIRKVPVHELDKKDPIFEPLRNQYKGFDKWLQKISNQGREAYVYFKENGNSKPIGAILILKIENETVEAIPYLPKKKRLKISTLSVRHHGYKIGELFLKISFSFAMENQIDEIYLTHFLHSNEDDELVRLIKEYGFGEHAVKENGEKLYLKSLIPPSQSKIKENTKFLYPLFREGNPVKKFIIPIQPKFHKRLFPDYHKNIEEDRYSLFSPPLITEGNTIKKAYLCHSATRQISNNDIIIFYRSKDWRLVTSLGIVEKICYGLTDCAEIQTIVAKRTVYSLDEIRSLAEKPTTVILFRWHCHFKSNLDYKELSAKEILKGPPQQITKLEHEQYLTLKDLVDLDERLIIN